MKLLQAGTAAARTRKAVRFTPADVDFETSSTLRYHVAVQDSELSLLRDAAEFAWR